MTEPRIALIGAGLGGMTAALALARAGFAPIVYEQAPALGEVGAGISMTPNATKALEALGLTAALAATANRPPRMETRHWRTGETLMSFDRTLARGEWGGDYYQLHRADLHAMLTEAFRATGRGGIALGKTLSDLAQAEGGPVILHFADGTTAEADIAIGCDGLRSPTRRLLHGEAEPEFTGYVASRGLTPANRLDAFDFSVECTTTISPGTTFTRYYIRGHDILNWVVLDKTDRNTAEGWAIPQDPVALAERFADWYPEVAAIIRATPPQSCTKWGLYVRQPLPVWRKGGVSLLGDAAHPMLPFMGMGAAMAIEDGVVLANALAAAGDPFDGLDRYEAARKERTTLVQTESALGGERLLGVTPEQFKNAPLRNEDTLGLFAYDAAKVAA